MSFSTLDALDLLKNQFAGGDRWTKGHLAVDSTGESVNPTNEGAVSFCLQGGISSLKCGQKFKDSAANRLAEAVSIVTDGGTDLLWDFNDDYGTDFKDILSVIRIAKKLVRSDRAKRLRRSNRAISKIINKINNEAT